MVKNISRRKFLSTVLLANVILVWEVIVPSDSKQTVVAQVLSQNNNNIESPSIMDSQINADVIDIHHKPSIIYVEV